MHHFKIFRTISLVFAFTLVSFSCVTSKNRNAIGDFGITAEAVPEGILLTFSNIPSDATQLWIGVSSWGDTEEPVIRNRYYSYAAIEDAAFQTWVNSTQNLNKVKQTGSIIFPIVQQGTKYHISAMIYNEHDRNLSMNYAQNFQPRTANAELTAVNGISFNRDDVVLDLNSSHSVITLSSEPIFSSEVVFDEQKYSFGVSVFAGDGSIGIGDHHFPQGLSSNGKIWAFEPYWTDVLKEHHYWLETGKYYPALGNAYVNIMYDDIKWSIEIAKTHEFEYAIN